jgi:hypothetical protein
MVIDDLAGRTLQSGSGALDDRLQEWLKCKGIVSHFDDL